MAGNGNVYVTGTSKGVNNDVATIKYDISGNQKSVKRYTDFIAQGFAIADSCAGLTHVAGEQSTNNGDFPTIVYGQSQQVDLPVTSFSLTQGSLTFGNLASLQSSDDGRMEMQPASSGGALGYPVTLVVEGIVPSQLTVNELCFEVESSLQEAGAIVQRVEFFNFVTSSWVKVDERVAPPPGSSAPIDTTIHLPAQYNPNEFINSPHVGNRTVKARVMYKQTSAVLLFPWTARIDFAGWHSVD